MWVAVGTGGATIAFSFNGENWFRVTGSYLQNGGVSLAWNGNMWLAGGSHTTTDNTIAYSFDGINWTGATGPFNTVRAIVWDG
jgi:hypothetical protein